MRLRGESSLYRKYCTTVTRSLLMRERWAGCSAQATLFTSVPMASMLIRISSPLCKVKESGGTIPVPVNKKQP